MTLYRLESLEHADKDVAHLCEGELLTNADSRAGIEGNVFVRLGVPAVPALWAKDLRSSICFGRFRVQVLSALHEERRVRNGRVLEHGQRLGAVGATTTRQRGVLERQAHIKRHGGIKTECLVDDGLEVRHVLDILVRGWVRGADSLENLAAELGDAFRVAAQLVQGPRECAGRGIATGKEDGNDLVAEDLAVAGKAGKSVQESVALLRLCVLAQLIRAEEQGLVNEVVDKVVNGVESAPECSLGNEWTEVTGSCEDILDVLDVVEGFGKLLLDGPKDWS